MIAAVVASFHPSPFCAGARGRRGGEGEAELRRGGDVLDQVVDRVRRCGGDGLRIGE